MKHHADKRLNVLEDMLRSAGLTNPNGKPLFEVEGDIMSPPRSFSDREILIDYVMLRVLQPVTVYKKAFACDGQAEVVVTLSLCKGTLIMLNTGQQQKQRASAAHVVRIEGGRKTACSNRESSFKYTVGKRVVPNRFDKNALICSNGIHFFLTRKLAQNYNWA